MAREMKESWTCKTGLAAQEKTSCFSLIGGGTDQVDSFVVDPRHFQVKVAASCSFIIASHFDHVNRPRKCDESLSFPQSTFLFKLKILNNNNIIILN